RRRARTGGSAAAASHAAAPRRSAGWGTGARRLGDGRRHRRSPRRIAVPTERLPDAHLRHASAGGLPEPGDVLNPLMSRHLRVSPRGTVLALTCAAALLAPASAFAAYSVGTHEQVSWVRRAAANFVAAELAGNGAGA